MRKIIVVGAWNPTLKKRLYNLGFQIVENATVKKPDVYAILDEFSEVQRENIKIPDIPQISVKRKRKGKRNRDWQK